MAENLHYLNTDTCNGDGICAEICPEKVLEVLDGKAATIASRAEACILCGQCVAVCPTESLRMPQLPGDNFGPLPKRPFDFVEFFDFLKNRRSVRVFKDQPVDKDLLDKILEAAATAPMGFPPHSTEVLVLHDRNELDFLLKQLVKQYDFIGGLLRVDSGASPCL